MNGPGAGAVADHPNREREVKLAAWAGFTLPDLSGLAEGVEVVELPDRVLDAVYYDTADLRLARSGATMRFRSGDGTGWTVKLPDGEDGPALVRRELPFPGEAASGPPEEATDLVAAYARSAALMPVARLQTRRQGVQLQDAERHVLVEVVADEVTVLDGERVAARFHEVEAEVDGRAPADLLDSVLERLQGAGAGAAGTAPKLVTALGARATAPPDLVVPELGESPSAGEVVRAEIASSVARILRHDAGVRLGDDPENVHQARVGTRRLRSDLRTFRSLVEPDWAGPLRDELSWLADLLGGVRDADVLTERLRRQAGELPEVDAAGFAPVLLRLSQEREAARSVLLVAMRSDRYLQLLDRLVAAANEPQLVEEVAAKPARDVVPGLVAKPWKALRKAVKGLPSDPPDEALHEVRIRAKRARYAAEAASPVFCKKAARFAKAVAGVQGVLGDQHDAVVAEAWLRDHVPGTQLGQALVVGELVAVQRAEAASCRKAWKKAWKDADRTKLRRWLE